MGGGEVSQFQGLLFMVKLAPLLSGLGEPEHHGGEERMEPRFSPYSSQETQRDGEGSGQDLPSKVHPHQPYFLQKSPYLLSFNYLLK